jgi:cytochrome P450
MATINRASSVDIVAPTFMMDPYPEMTRWRKEGGIHWIESQHAWCLSRYKDIRQALMDNAILSNDVMRPFIKYAGRSNPAMRHFEEWMPFTDQPMHTRIRGSINTVFLPKSIEEIRPLIERQVNSLLSKMIQDDRGVDFVSGFASLLPSYVMGSILGVPDEDLERISNWSRKLVRFVFISMGEAGIDRFVGVMEVLQETREYFAQLITKRRSVNGGLVIDALIAANNRREINEHEVISTCMMLLLAGNDATTMHLTNSIRGLFLHPEQRKMLYYRRADGNFLRNSIRELMRWDSASFLVARIAREDYPIGDYVIPAGERVYLCLASANRDEDIFEEPERLNLEREDAKKVITMGQGIHTCLGNHLVYLISEIAFPIILEKLSEWEMGLEELHFTDLTTFRSARNLPLIRQC